MGAIDTASGAIGVLESAPDVPRGLPIVFLHGVGSTKEVWRPQIDAFGCERRAVAIDWPGYGESAPRPGTGRDGFARAVVESMDALGIERAHICGLSLGGVVAIALHALAPDRCASLVLADSFALHPEGQAIYDRSVAASAALGMGGLAAARAPSLVAPGTAPALIDEVVRTMATIDRDAYVQGAEAVWLADQADRAAVIAVPTLVVVGADDSITPPALSAELARLAKAPAPTVIAGAGHLANIEQPDAFNRAVNEFITKMDTFSEG